MTFSDHTISLKAGDYLPEVEIKGSSIYERLSSTHWTLIVCGKQKIKFQLAQLKILHVPDNTYKPTYILIKPDWHVALVENEISESALREHLSF